MRKQLDHRGGFSFILLLIVAAGLTVGVVWQVANGMTALKSAILLVVLVTIWLLVLINIRQQTLDYDEENLYWKPLMTAKTYAIPLSHVVSVKYIGPSLTREGFHLLHRYSIKVRSEQSELLIKFMIKKTKAGSAALQEFCRLIDESRPQFPTGGA